MSFSAFLHLTSSMLTYKDSPWFEKKNYFPQEKDHLYHNTTLTSWELLFFTCYVSSWSLKPTVWLSQSLTFISAAWSLISSAKSSAQNTQCCILISCHKLAFVKARHSGVWCLNMGLLLYPLIPFDMRMRLSPRPWVMKSQELITPQLSSPCLFLALSVWWPIYFFHLA